MKLNNGDYKNIIVRTMLEYILERKAQYVQICIDYRHCINMSKRRKLRQEKGRLLAIISRDLLTVKANITSNYGIKYKELKNYPEFVETKRKQKYLQNAIL